MKVTVQRDTAAESDVGGVILSRAADHDADLIVMGIYGHSRMRERVLGGASRTLLASMTVPLLVAHELEPPRYERASSSAACPRCSWRSRP